MQEEGWEKKRDERKRGNERRRGMREKEGMREDEEKRRRKKKKKKKEEEEGMKLMKFKSKNEHTTQCRNSLSWYENKVSKWNSLLKKKNR